MKLKRTVFLQTVVVALGLLLGASAASGAVPEPATLISPSGTISDNTPTYTWNAVANSAQYRLWVWDSTKTKKLDQWYTAEEAGCSDGTGECSVTPETMMAGDSHEWWIQTWNDDGRGDWSDELSFTIPPAPVPRTGQTLSVSAGDDGDLQKGVPWPDPRFTDNSDGTVTDNLTGLIWLKNAGCISGIWTFVLDAANNLADGDCGLSDGSQPGDWRLPNVRELQSLIDFGSREPAVPDPNPFDKISETTGYFSSTSGVDPGEIARDAWAVYFVNGTSMLAEKERIDVAPASGLWPVRGGN